MPEKPVAIRQYYIVNPQIFKYLDYSKWCTRQNTFLGFLIIQETYILVQIENVSMTESLDVFPVIGHLLQVLVLTTVENGIVDNDSIHCWIAIRLKDLPFKFFSINLAKLKFEAAGILLENRNCRTK